MFSRAVSALGDLIAPDFCCVLFFLCLLGGANAQTPRSTVGKLSGVVTDPSGAVIPGATIHVERHGAADLSAESKIPNVTSDAVGAYAITLALGTYDVTVIADGFDPFVSTVTVSRAGAHLNAALTIVTANEQVNVFANQNSTSAGENKSALVLGAAELSTLSDDDATFQQQIEAIAGGDPTQGASIYVDGFPGGQMPPKDAIREIRINQNPYSAQYPEIGFGRIEIFTKPGSDKWHGHFMAFANDDSFNAKNPFAGTQPPYYILFTRGNVSGPIGKKTSLFVNSFYNDVQNNSVINAILPSGNYTNVVPSPTTNIDVTARLDRQVTANNVFTGRYEIRHFSQPTCGLAGCVAPFNGNGPPPTQISSQILESQAFSTASTTQTLQLSDSQNIGKNKILETRFQWIRAHSAQTPVSTAATTTVQGYFGGGGAPSQQASDHTDQFEFQEYFSMEEGKHFLRLGGRYHGYRDANFSRAGYNGAFTYAPTTQGTTTISALTNYENNAPSQYNVTTGTPAAAIYTGDFGIYADDEWRVRKDVTLNYGLRVESQSAIPDHFDPAPRVGASWAIGQTEKRAPIVTLRSGFGLFYDRFAPANILTAVRQESGTLQQQYIVTAVPAGCTPTSPQPCTGLPATPPTLYGISPQLRAEYQVVTGLTAERTIGKMGKVSVNYLHFQGNHDYISLNVNAPLPGTYVPGEPGSGTRPMGGTQNVYQFASTASHNTNFVFANTQLNFNKHVSYWAFFGARFRNGDTGGATSFPSNQYDLRADYGRAATATDRLFNGANFTLPWGITSDVFVAFTSHQPFNITIGNDLNGDTQYNDRPSFATTDCATCQIFHTPYGTFNANPQPGEKIIPINYANGPRFFYTEFSLEKSFRWGTRPPAPPAAPAVAGKPAAKPELPPKPYELSFSAEIDNVLNHPNYAPPVGVLTSPEFGQVLSLNSTFIGSPNANRMIYIGTRFNF